MGPPKMAPLILENPKPDTSPYMPTYPLFSPILPKKLSNFGKPPCGTTQGFYMAWCTLDPSNPQTTTCMELAELIGDIESYVRAEGFIGFRVFRVSPKFWVYWDLYVGPLIYGHYHMRTCIYHVYIFWETPPWH